MIKHVVMFKMKDKEKNLQTAKEMLLKIPVAVTGLCAYDVAENMTELPFGYDLVLNSAFESMEFLGAYAECAAHQEFLKFIVDAAEKIAEVNYEV